MSLSVSLDNWKKLPAESFPETPFYLYDMSVLEQVWNYFYSHAKDIANYRVYFSMKSNNNPAILNFFRSKGCGIDVVSQWELLRALELGFAPKDIVFSGAGKSTAELKVAVTQGIKLINIESADEFFRLKKIAQETNTCVSIGFRVNPDVDASTHPYIATGLRMHKFGIDFDTALDLYRRAAQDKHLFKCSAISVHIGSQIQNVETFKEAFFKVKAFVDRLTSEGIVLDIFDIGGGLGLNYENPNRVADFSGYLKVVSELSAAFKNRIHIGSELGRALVAQAGMLVTRVIGQKSNGEKDFLFVDASMTELMRPALYQARHSMALHSNRQNVGHSNSTYFEVVGPVCESSDVFGADYLFPRDISENDLLAIQLAGAYGHVMSSRYNLRPTPKEYLLHDAQSGLVLSR